MTNPIYNRYTVILEEDSDGELILPFPEELLNELGWKEGDNLQWKFENGKIVISKKDN